MRRILKGKHGTCPRYRNEKTKYWKRSVAEFDRAMMQSKFPGHSFNVFRCDGCGHWHIGRGDAQAT